MEGIFTENLIAGFVFSLLAGLSTAIGAAVALFVKKTDTKLLTFALGASAGVMIYISFVEMLPEARHLLEEHNGTTWFATLAFFGGMAVACAIDRLIPEDENPHEFHTCNCCQGQVQPTGQFSSKANIKRSAFLFALAIAIHNFPEGIATIAAAFDNVEIAAAVALAVAIHNIPEGIAVALPLLYGTGSRKKAFAWSVLSGLAEPLGALVGMLILLPFIGPTMLAILFALVAGIMVYISLDELLPMAERWGHHHLSIYGVATGMLIMALVL